MTGLFISFEGGEGSGKTTQINKLAENLTAKGQRVVTTREPGGTPEGDKIRDLIVQREGGRWNPIAETLLLFAARSMHVQKIIQPALEDGNIVITDRFTDSTLAYQGYGHGVSLEKIEHINSLVLDDFKPDLTFILDVKPEEGLMRSERRLASETLGVKQTEDKFERLDLKFHKSLREGFLDIARKDKQRCHILNASLSIEELSKEIERIVMEKVGA